jgi:hypothetical protein
MTWATMGWVLIGVAAALLLVFTWVVKRWRYPLRKRPFVGHYSRARAATIEQGRRGQIVLGHTLWSHPYPGLGLSSLTGLSAALDPEALADGQTTVSATAGTLAAFANQILQGRYQGGFSEDLLTSKIYTTVYGPTTFSFTAGLMSDLKMRPYGSLMLLGDFGPEAAISIKNIHDQFGDAFVAAGTIGAQAALFPNVPDILLGEEAFLAASLLAPDRGHKAAALTEDLLRSALILALVIGAILKAVGVL